MKAEPGWRSACAARLNWLAEVPALEHRLHGSRPWVEGYERRRRAVRVPQHPVDRGAGLLLQGEVDGRRDPQPAAEHAPGAVVVDELVLDVVQEVRRLAAGARQADVLGQALGAVSAAGSRGA